MREEKEWVYNIFNKKFKFLTYRLKKKEQRIIYRKNLALVNNYIINIL